MARTNITSALSCYCKRSLHVENLHPDVTEAMLYDKFGAAGPILSIHVYHDMIKRRSLGYADVNFQLPADAERAIDTMNFDLLCGRPLRILWPPDDPQSHYLYVPNVFIGNLSENIDNKSIYDTLSAFGDILSCDLIYDETGRSEGCCFLCFKAQEAADNAVNKVNRMLLADRNVYVGHYMSCNQHADVGGRRLYLDVLIKDFGDEVDEKELRELFSKHGKIVHFKLETDQNGYSVGFAFCSFENLEEAKNAVRNLDGYQIGNKQLYVGLLQKKYRQPLGIMRKKDIEQELTKKSENNVVHVKNLDNTIDEEQLKKEFSKFGTIINARIMAENGGSNDYGFIYFSTPGEAAKAVARMNGAVINIKELYVALAQPKDENRVYLKREDMSRIATSLVPPQMQLPHPTGMGGMHLPTPMGPLRLRNFIPQTGMPIYRPTQPHWPSRPIRPTLRPAQMIIRGLIRPQINEHVGQQPTVYIRQALNTPPNNSVGFASSIAVPNQEPLTPAALADATLQEQEQKQMLGERLFPLIQQMQLDLVGNITSKLFKIRNTEPLHILESLESLKATVQEAITIVQDHQAKQLNVTEHTAPNSTVI